jgi:regulator of RNase E activity RraA
LVVADGDGVVVVPSDLIYDVAKWAAREMNADRASRRKLYEALGRELDDTV